MNRFRHQLHKSRGLIHLLVLLQAFFMVGGVEAVEARQQGILQAQAEDARMARTFGLSAEQWRVEDPSWIDRSAERVVDEAQEIFGHSRTEVARLLDDLRRSEDLAGSPSQVTQAVAQNGGPVGEGLAEEARPQRQIKPYIPRRSALEAGEGERTVARAPRSAKLLPGLGGSTEDDLPLHVLQRKAQTVDAGSLPAAQKISSAIAPASPKARSAKSNKTIAPEVVALAASLDNSPAKIFRYVHDQITYDPKWGVDSTALGTLWEGRGTSWDQAWLLQELLIAAGIDARLEWGQVEIPPSLLTNLTGIDDPIRAGDFLTTAGLEVLLVIQGSQVSAARFPHVWVKAHLDYIPNRGVTLGTADTWIRMDPSITTHERTDGLRLDQDVPFVLGDHLLSGTELSPRQDYEAALMAHVADQGLPVASLDDAKSLHRQVADEFPFVPGTLRAKIVNAAGESETVPAAFEQDVEVQIREEGGGALLTWTTTASNLYGKRLETVWLGATSSDQAALDLYGGIFATPPYEVELRPTLRLDGVEVASGTAIGSAEDAEIQLTLTPPDGSGQGDGTATVAGWDLFAGEHGVLTVDYGRAPPELADRFAQEVLNAAGNDFETEGWQLAQAASSYLHNLGGDLTHLVDLSWHRLLTFNTAVFAVKRGAVSTSPDGTPQTFSPGPLALDVGAMPLAVMPVDGVQTSTVPTLELLGSQGSFREGEALASVFGGEHLTAVTFLTRAAREGQVVTKVDLSNLDDALAGAEISGDAKGAIRFAVEQLGMEAWISEAQIESNTFQTTGYILIDPATGSGGYFVTFERRFTPLDGAVTFHNPIDLDVITAPTDVIASIDAEGIESWTLSTRPLGGSSGKVIATGTGPVDNTVLGQFDPTLLLNGMHDIVLTGQNAAGEPVSGRVTVMVEGQMKLGHFSVSFVDLAVPLAGLDLDVVRTYDSRDKEVGDFGVGWTIDIRQGSYRNNRPPGDGWQILNPGGLLGLPCTQTKETKSHLTTIRLSDREIYRFRLTLKRPAVIIGGCVAEAEFDFIDGPIKGATLEVVGNNRVVYLNASDEVTDFETNELFVPNEVRLTTRDGRIFELDLENGVNHLEDPEGNALEITPNGITHSSGRGVEFVRDAEGRIERIVDPLDRSILYDYDANGDLVTVTERNGAETRFTYSGNHYLEDIINALGVRAVRTEYDDDGRMIRLLDADGNAIDVNHDMDNRREVIANRIGGVRVLEYDNRGNVIRETDENNDTTVRLYDGEDNLLSETDPLGRTTTYAYTSENDLRRVVDAQGGVTEMIYNDRGRPVTFTNPLGDAFQIRYDSRGNPIEIEDALDAVTRYQYNGNGKLAQMTNPADESTSFAYDPRGNLTKVTDALGNETTYTYDDVGNRLTKTRTRTLADGSTESLLTQFGHDDLDRLVSVTYPDGSIERVTYDDLGRRDTATDVLGRTTTFVYDERSRLSRIDYPDSTSESWTYNAEDHITSRTDSSGYTTTFVHDPVGRVIEIHHADGAIARQEHDAAGQVVARTDPEGHRSEFYYDVLGRQTGFTLPNGSSNTIAYDAVGRVAAFIDGKGQETQFQYDAQGNLLQTTLPDGSVTSSTYDANGRRIGEIDAEGHPVDYAYDDLGRLIQVTDALGGETTFAYDELDHLTSQTDALGRVTRFEYDNLGRRTARVLPDGSRETRTWLLDGSLASYTDFGGSTTTFAYDDRGRPILRTYADGSTVQTVRAPSGQRLSVIDGRGTTQYTYDQRHRLLSATDPSGHRVAYTYDRSGNRTSIAATVGGTTLTTTMAYDGEDRLTEVTDPLGGVYGFTYDNNGNMLTQTSPNGLVTTSVYDALDRRTGVTTRSGSGDILDSFVYTLDSNGRRARVDELDGGSVEYFYDELYRLTQEEIRDVTDGLVYRAAYTYDAVGNRTQQVTEDGLGGSDTTTFTYDSRDRLVQATPGNSFSWDANGNLVGEGSEAMYEWDLDHQMVRAELGDGIEANLTHDADGFLVGTEIGPDGELPKKLDLLLDIGQSLVDRDTNAHERVTPGSQVVAEIHEGSIETLFVRGGDLLLGLIQPSSDEQRYYHTDAMGSIRSLSDSDGAVTDRFGYSAFGETLESTGEDESPYRFVGEYLIPELGFYDLRARFLDPRMGRFTSMDPFLGVGDVPISLHRYQYADLDPVNRRDPNGLFSVGEISIVSSIRSVLSSIQIDVGMSILTQPALDPDGDISKIFILLAAAQGGVGLVKAVGALARGTFGVVRRAGAAFTEGGRRVLQSIRQRLSGAFRAGARSCSCFAAGTEVMTQDGLRPIEELQLGDQVWSRDDESGSEGWKPIEAIFINDKDLLEITVRSEDGDEDVILATAEHPIWVMDEGWQDASEVQEGDALWTLSGAVEVQAITWTGRRETVYNLEVDDFHTYFVGDLGLWAHNSCQTRGWSSASVNQANRLLDIGETQVTVNTRDEAAELFLGKYFSEGYTNTNGLSGSGVKQTYGSKKKTYHWDEVFDDEGYLVGHAKDNPHAKQPHLQIHDENRNVIRIFFREF